MHRGILLSTDIHSTRLPWAPSYPARSIQSPGLSDPLWQFVPWLSFARGELAAGRLPLWNPHQDGGVPLLGNFISALLSPLVWPALLLGIHPGWNLSLLARVLFAAASAFLFLRDLGRSRAASALGAAAYSLSGPFVAWLEHPQSLAAAPVPLLLLFVRRTVLAPGFSPGAVAGVAVSTFLVLAGGHPETALMAAILAAGVLFATPGPSRSRVAAVGGAVVGAFLTAPALLPSIEYYLASVARGGEGRRWFVLPIRDLARFVVPRLEGSNGIEAAAAVSIVVLLLVPIGLRVSRKEPEIVFWSAASLVILLAVYESPLSRLLGSATPVYWTRLLLFLPLALAVPASAGLDALRELLARRLGARPAASRLAAVVLVAACGVELLLRAAGVHGVNPPGRVAETTPLIERLRSQPGPFRVLPLRTELTPNSATVYGLDDVRGYDALAPSGWRRVRAAIGRFRDVPTQRDAIEPWDLAPGGAALDEWNVAYLVAPPQYAFTPEVWKERIGLDLKEIYAGPDGRILENLRVKPRVRLDGAGEVSIRERVPGLWRLAVRGSASDRLTVADPYFPGWRAKLDGVGVPLLASPGEPMRVAIPPGANGHEVELAYRPGSFRAGVALAAAGVAILCVLVLGFRRRGPTNAKGASE